MNAIRPHYDHEGKYRVRNRNLRLALKICDILSYGVARLRRRKSLATKPRRILISNIAHIGDVLISTSVIPVLRKAFPEAHIGFLVGSWSAQVVRDHPDIARVHILDNYFLNRSSQSRLWSHVRTWVRALGEIRAENYDTAIDLYFHWPNTIPLLWAAGIPRRIGYDSGGFGPLLTDAHALRAEEQHTSALQCALLRSLGLKTEQLTELRMSLSPMDKDEFTRICGGVPLPDQYVVLHPGTGSPEKGWLVHHWIALAQHLTSAGHDVVITGKGALETEIAMTISQRAPGCLVLCDKLSWREFRFVVRSSRLLIGVNSMAGHLAAAEGTPFVVIHHDATYTEISRPLGYGKILIAPLLSVSPSRSHGYKIKTDMDAVRPEEVFEACQKSLAAPIHDGGRICEGNPAAVQTANERGGRHYRNESRSNLGDN